MKKSYQTIKLILLSTFIFALGSAASSSPTNRSRDHGVAQKANESANRIIIKDAWLQEGPPNQKITAAFMQIQNNGPDAVALVAASTDVASVVEIHKIEIQDGVMKMVRMDQLVIPGNGSVELKPGSYHLMVIGLNKVLKEGDEAKFVLKFANAVEKSIVVPVKRRIAKDEE